MVKFCITFTKIKEMKLIILEDGESLIYEKMENIILRVSSYLLKKYNSYIRK